MAACFALNGLGGCVINPIDCPSLGTSVAVADTETLRCHALNGNQIVAMELGSRYEEGRGVRRDLNEAVRFYTIAAQVNDGRAFIYVPPAGPATHRTVLNTKVGEPRMGVDGASEALARVRAKRRGVSG